MAVDTTAARKVATPHAEAALSLLTIVWSWAAGVCSALAIFQFAIWLQRRREWAHLWLMIASLGAAGNAVTELAQLHATGIDAYGRALRLQHYPIFVVVVGLVWFVDSYLGTPRRWLGAAISAAWVVTLVINQGSPHSIIFSEIDSLQRVALPWGESFSVASGTPHAWKMLPDLTIPAFLFFVADAAWSQWRRGDRRRALVVGGGIVAFMGFAGIHSPLVDYGVVRTPYLITFAFLAIVLAMSLELSHGVVRVATLSREIKANERRWRTVLKNVRLLVVGVNRDAKIDYVGPFFCEVTGFAQEDVLGLSLASIVPSDEVEERMKWLRTGIADGFPPHSEFRIRCSDGDDRICYWSTVRLHDPEGRVTGLLGIGTDLTEQRAAEKSRDDALERTEAILREVQELRQRLEEEVIYLQDEIESTGQFKEMVGSSDSLGYVLRRIEQVAPLDTTVLIEGETGVGKELVARAIHARSPRRARPLIKVNCAALPPTLVETELFGHEKGAFTGATRTRRGRFELADQATLFLDEVGELPLELQAKLLRVLEDGEFERVGGERTVKVDVRLITATNRKLSQEVEAGRFREDLFYRIHVYPLTVPPLRERKEDISALAGAFVTRFSKAHGRSIDRIPQPVMEELRRYDWPGNIRELANVIERAVITSPAQTLRLAGRLVSSGSPKGEGAGGYRGELREVEREYITTVLDQCGWRIEGNQGAAGLLGLHPNTLRHRMGKLGITRPTAPPS